MRAAAVILLLAVSVTLPGCLEADGGTRPRGSGDRGAPALLVEEFYWVNATGGGHLQGDLGPHCSNVTYNATTREVTLIEPLPRGGPPLPAAPEALVIRHFNGPPPGTAGYGNLSWNLGSATVLHAFPTENGSLYLPPLAIDRELPLLEVELRDGTFLVNGTALPDGGTRTLRYDYPVIVNGTRYDVSEELRFLNLGQVPYRVEKASAYCD